MRVWGATPEPKPYVLCVVCFRHYHFRYPKTAFQAHSVQRYACLGRHPRTHTTFLWHGAFQTLPFLVSKNTFSGPQCAEVCVFGYLGWSCLKCIMPKTIWCGFRAGAPNTHTSARCRPEKGVFGYLKWCCLKRTMPKNMVWVLGWRHKHAYLCTLWARKGVFGYLKW